MKKDFSLKVDNEKLITILRKARKNHGKSQLYLANILGMSQKGYSVIEMEIIDEIVKFRSFWKPYCTYRNEVEKQIKELECKICGLEAENAILREQNLILVKKLCANQ